MHFLVPFVAYRDYPTPRDSYTVPNQKRGACVPLFDLVPAHGVEPQARCRQYGRIRLMAYCNFATPRDSYTVPNQKRGGLVSPFLIWCRHTESNRGPEVYKTPALPAELYRHCSAGGELFSFEPVAASSEGKSNGVAGLVII